jgi:hypothetical protein
MRGMLPTRNIALLAGGGIAIAIVAFLSGRRSGTADSSLSDAASTRALVVPDAASPPAAAMTMDAGAAKPPAPLGDPNATADLFTRLQKERETRLKLEPTADSVFASMKKKGVEEDEELQVAGFVVGARYCDKVRTKKDVHVVVCEFDDEASAIKGVSFGENKAIKGREILRNKATTCAVYAADEKSGAAEAAKIKELFKAL